MAKFEQGNPIGEATRISGDVAGEMQARSVEARKRNKTLRETLLAALMEDGGGGKTRLEHLVLKAMDNHRKGRLTFHDLKDLAGVLGEENPPLGIALLMEGEHLCKTMRGARKPGKMSTCKVTGIFRDDISARNEFLQLARELIKEKV